jgi:hypothetical protein
MPKPEYSFLTTAEHINGRVSGGGAPITVRAARSLVREGRGISVPEASASSTCDLFVDTLHFSEIRTVEHSSSAGDWTFAVRVYSKWRILSQHNRWPYAGFEYRLGAEKFPSFEAACDFACPSHRTNIEQADQLCSLSLAQSNKLFLKQDEK